MKRLLWIGAAAVAVIAAALVWWVVTAGDEPAEVDLSAAVAGLATTTAVAESPADTAEAGDDTRAEADADAAEPSEITDEAAESPEASEEPDEPSAGAADPGADGTDESGDALSAVAGAWTVDTTIGDFDFEQATGSFAGFRVDEELTIGEVTAVGRTGEVSGFIQLGAGGLEAAEITVDMSAIESDRPLRDGRTRQALGTDQFPTATFVLTEPVALPADAADGAAFSLEAAGELTVKGVANPAVFALDAQLVDDVIVVVGSTEVTFADYGVQAPSAPIVISVEDHGIIEFQLLFTR